MKSSEKTKRMINFIKFFIQWVANNLSIPFWMVGHVHLTMNVYEDIHEILMSFGMNILVGIGFWLDWRENRQKK
jgi:hypothetical protein